MPLTGAIPEGRSFFCPHCGALYAVTYSRLSDSDSNVARCVVCGHGCGGFWIYGACGGCVACPRCAVDGWGIPPPPPMSFYPPPPSRPPLTRLKASPQRPDNVSLVRPKIETQAW